MICTSRLTVGLCWSNSAFAFNSFIGRRILSIISLKIGSSRTSLTLGHSMQYNTLVHAVPILKEPFRILLDPSGPLVFCFQATLGLVAAHCCSRSSTTSEPATEDISRNLKTPLLWQLRQSHISKLPWIFTNYLWDPLRFVIIHSHSFTVDWFIHVDLLQLVVTFIDCTPPLYHEVAVNELLISLVE